MGRIQDSYHRNTLNLLNDLAPNTYSTVLNQEPFQILKNVFGTRPYSSQDESTFPYQYIQNETARRAVLTNSWNSLDLLSSIL